MHGRLIIITCDIIHFNPLFKYYSKVPEPKRVDGDKKKKGGKMSIIPLLLGEEIKWNFSHVLKQV